MSRFDDDDDDVDESVRSVLGPAGNNNNNNNKLVPLKQQALSKTKTNNNNKLVPKLLRSQSQLLSHHHQQQQRSLNASCSSADSLQSRASTGRRLCPRPSITRRTRQSFSDTDSHSSSLDTFNNSSSPTNKRCAWVTPNTEPCYAAFHDEEWGVPVHDDKKLFELLVFSGALAELTWPSILMKRNTFREVFADFDPVSISKMNDKKVMSAPGLLSELKLRAIIENARQITKIINEYGSFDKYIWSFVNYKPIVNSFRYPRQIPAKTSKADVISKDLLRRGFRSVSATVIYSFMQVAGITNDHLTTCFRYRDCLSTPTPTAVPHLVEDQQDKPNDMLDLGLARAMDDLIFPSE